MGRQGLDGCPKSGDPTLTHNAITLRGKRRRMIYRSSICSFVKKGLFVFALMCAAASAYASDNTADIGAIHVTASYGDESPSNPASFATIITPKKSMSRSKTVSELISESAGVDVKSSGGIGQMSTISMRGSSSEQTAVFMDGVKLNSPIFGSVDFSTIPVDSVKRIEIIRGSSSARFGTDAIGGVINIITDAANHGGADFSVAAGSFETLKIHESIRKTAGRWNFMASHDHMSTGGDFSFKSAQITMAGRTFGGMGTFTRIHNESIRENALTKAVLEINDAWEFSILNNFTWMDRDVPGTEEETTLLYPSNPLNAHQNIVRNMVNAVIKSKRFIVPSLSFELGAAYLFDRDAFTDATPAIGNAIDVTYTSHSPQAHLKLAHYFSGKRADLSSILRLQYRYDRSHDFTTSIGSSMGLHSRGSVSSFLEETLGILDDRLVFVSQGRIEKANGRKFETGWRFGMEAKPMDWIKLKSNIQRSFRYPNFSELYYPDQGYIRGNPDLNDEKSIGWDAGFIAYCRFIKFEFDYFQNRIENQILFVPISATTIQPINTYDVFSHGIELSLNLHPIKFMHFDANYTLTSAHFSSSNAQLPGRPRHKFNIKGYATFWRLSPFANVQYVGSFPVNVSNTVWISGHTSVNAGLTAEISKHIYSTFEIKDITNVQMYDSRAFPLPRRSFWLTVGAKI